MNKKTVEKISYNKLYEFIVKSETATEFIERIKTLATILLQELIERVTKHNVRHPLQLIPLIDEMNLETMKLIEKINDSKIVDNQRPVLNTMLLQLIQNHNPKMHTDYMYAKTALQN